MALSCTLIMLGCLSLGVTPLAHPATAQIKSAFLGSSNTGVPSEPATAANSTSLPGVARLSQYRSPRSANWAACRTCPPDCDAASGRYRRLPAVERGRRLIKAAKRGAVGEVAALLAAGAHLEARDGHRKTALYWAARGGHVETARRLLFCGAQAGARSSEQWTPLHAAAYTGQADAARLLLVAGADVNARNERRYTPLHLGAQEGHAALVRLLAAAGADLNARTDKGWTPLHWAAYKGYAEAAAALLREGADRDATTMRGNTPLALAKQEKHKTLVDLLTQS